MGNGGKGGGGDSHQRAIARAKTPPIEITKKPEVDTPEHPPISATERILRFVDHGSTQTLAGLVGGLVGTFLDGRYFSALGLIVSYGLYKSKALEGIKHRMILPIHIICVTIAAIGFYTYTPTDYANAVRKILPGIPPSTTTNIYRTSGAAKKDPPKIDIQVPRLVSTQGTSLLFNLSVINIGGQTALRERLGAYGMYGPMSKTSEDAVFKRLKKEERWEGGVIDQNVGSDHALTAPIELTPTKEEKSDYESGKTLEYFGIIVSYFDAEGREYHTEYCSSQEYGTNLLPHFCLGHNRTYLVTKQP